MPEEIDRNQIDSGSRGRSMHKGDVPDPMKRRYFLDEKGGPGLGFYVDAQVKAPAFRDLGTRLVAGRADPNAIRDMAAVAHHRGWTAVTVHGDARFRREVWLASAALGIEVRGYEPSQRDRQELERRVEQTTRRSRSDRDSSGAGGARGDAATFKVVEAVVRSRVTDQPAQDRILQAARERIASWLERGAQLRPAQSEPAAYSQVRSRERQRSR